MNYKYHLSYTLKETEEQAQQFCARENADATPYARKKYPAHYTPYTITNNDGRGNPWNGFVCWYYQRSAYIPF